MVREREREEVAGRAKEGQINRSEGGPGRLAAEAALVVDIVDGKLGAHTHNDRQTDGRTDERKTRRSTKGTRPLSSALTAILRAPLPASSPSSAPCPSCRLPRVQMRNFVSASLFPLHVQPASAPRPGSAAALPGFGVDETEPHPAACPAPLERRAYNKNGMWQP